jgi:hypothetical protein
MKAITNKFIVLALAVVCCLPAYAQNATSSNALGRIYMTAYIPQQNDKLPEGARSVLISKLNQIIMQGGMSGSTMSSGFIITANIAVLSKDLLATAPPSTALGLEVTLAIGDGISGTKFATTTVNVKGVGTNETKAYLEAIKMIKANDPSVQAFVTTGKNKIIEYYNTRCDFILKEAVVLESQSRYEEALYKLAAVPDVAACYDKAVTAMASVYKKYIDRECKVKLLNARTTWTASQNLDGANAAANILGTIDPEAACYKEAVAFTQEIGKRVYELENREWNFKLQVQKDNTDIAKGQIGAYRDIAVAFANGQPQTLTYNILGWW